MAKTGKKSNILCLTTSYGPLLSHNDDGDDMACYYYILHINIWLIFCLYVQIMNCHWYLHKIIVPADRWGHSVGQCPSLRLSVHPNYGFQALSKKHVSSVYFKPSICAYWVSLRNYYIFGCVSKYLAPGFHSFHFKPCWCANWLSVEILFFYFWLCVKIFAPPPLLLDNQSTHLKGWCLLLVLVLCHHWCVVIIPSYNEVVGGW